MMKNNNIKGNNKDFAAVILLFSFGNQQTDFQEIYIT